MSHATGSWRDGWAGAAVPLREGGREGFERGALQVRGATDGAPALPATFGQVRPLGPTLPDADAGCGSLHTLQLDDCLAAVRTVPVDPISQPLRHTRACCCRSAVNHRIPTRRSHTTQGSRAWWQYATPSSPALAAHPPRVPVRVASLDHSGMGGYIGERCRPAFGANCVCCVHVSMCQCFHGHEAQWALSMQGRSENRIRLV